MIKKIIFIIGGAKSGKSNHAQFLARKTKGRVAFIATGEARDVEMKKRIEMHRKTRPKSWTTFEEPVKLCPLVNKIGNKFDLIIIDCLTLYVSNLLCKKYSEMGIEENINILLRELNKIKAGTIIVSNEVGSGIVPVNKRARAFRDIAGKANQLFSKNADEVFFMVSGLPMRLK